MNVFVIVAPHITEYPKNQTVPYGQAIKLFCAAVGYPLPIITWTHDNQQKHSQPLDETNSTFIRTALDVEEKHSGGTYHCSAKTNGSVNGDSASATITGINIDFH